MAEVSVVVEAISAGVPERLVGGERCDTDCFLPKAVGDHREVSPKIGGSAGGVELQWEDRLSFGCGTQDRDVGVQRRT